MNHAIFYSALLLLGLSPHAIAIDQQCPAIARDSATCRCGNDLKRVILTPPRGLELRAACDLRKNEEGFRPIPKNSRVNLDQYDSHGNGLIGIYYFRGRLRMTGILEYHPSDGGELFFWPDKPVDMPKTTIEPYFRTLTLIPVGKYAKYSIDKAVIAKGCAKARAEINVKELRIDVNDSEQAGAYPTSIDLLKISPYKAFKCE